jgi:hypothetical protein
MSGPPNGEGGDAGGGNDWSDMIRIRNDRFWNLVRSELGGFSCFR